MVKIIRYAKHGFKGYLYIYEDTYCPKFINWKSDRRVDMVSGCFIFIEEVDEDALTGIAGNRYYQSRNEIYVPDETLVWVDNTRWYVNDGGEIKFDKSYRDIKDTYLAINAWVQIPIVEVAHTVKDIKNKTGEINFSWCEAIYFSGEFEEE